MTITGTTFSEYAMNVRLPFPFIRVAYRLKHPVFHPPHGLKKEKSVSLIHGLFPEHSIQ